MEEERKTGVSDKKAGADGAESRAGMQAAGGASEVFVADEVKSVSGAAGQSGQVMSQGAKGRPLTEQA